MHIDQRADDSSHQMIMVDRDVRIPTDDPEVTLSAVVYRPVGTDAVPALVSVYPYRSDAWIHEYMRPYMEWFAQRGYASVLVDLLGTGGSDGVLRPFHDPSEADDGVWSVRWAAAQEWCTGSVGMWGLSFGGFMTMATAQRNPAELKAIMPVMNSLDPERETMHPQGARGGLQPLVQWGLQQLTYQLLPPMLDHEDPAQQRRWHERISHDPALMDLAVHGPGHPIWKERVLHPESITTPAYCVGGWRDSFQWSIPRAYELMQGPKRLMMGPWGHVIPQSSPFLAIDFREMALRWWDYWLRGVENGVMEEPPVVVYVQGAEPEWCSLSSWPPAVSSELSVSSSDEGGLLYDGGNGSSGAMVYNPDPRIGPYSGIQCIGASSRLVLPLDQHQDDMRSCTLTTDAFAEDVVICGLPEFTIQIDGIEPEQSIVERVVVRLTDVDPSGRSMMITTCLATSVVTQERCSLLFWPTAYRLAAGHRLRVVVSDSAFPWLVPLAEPQPFRVVDVTLRVPMLGDDDARSIDVALAHEPLSGLTHAESNWAIEEEPNLDGLGFRTSSRRDYTTPQGHQIREDARSGAYVSRGAPQDVVYRGEQSIVATMRSGEKVVVTASVNTTHGVMIADADVTIGNVRAFSNQWIVPLSVRESDRG
jgi:putative CocE/NonD family hydrolase